MKRSTTLAVLATLGLSAALVAPAASQSTERTEIHAYEVEEGYSKLIDERREGLSPGDMILENLPVFDAATDERVGDTVTIITAVRGPQSNPLLWIDCEVGLAGGSITFAGGERMGDMFGGGATFSVTGGTGDYRDVTGTVTAKHGERDGRDIFTFDFDVVI
ncbi:MAG: hypothetical protein ACR2LG_02895 [Actinomycetota bacterium]